ncbi:MAG TPA: helix-turn-helix domain-containing protein [Terriglobia bacterium]|nr:helix-turn-helix domain-containing protein [Terriglobia bacterium]
MGEARPLSKYEIREIEAEMKAARTADDLRRALCVWLPEALGLNLPQISAAVGWCLNAVRQVRARYLARGASGLHDGRQRPFASGAAQELRGASKRARNVEEFKRIQCVLLRVLFDLDSKQVAAAVGWSRCTVSGLQSTYRAGGLAAILALGDPALVPENTALQLCAAMKAARTAGGLRRAQCLFLRLALGFPSGVVARILGWRRDSVQAWVQDYRRHGDAALRRSGRGGRRWRLLTHKQEAAVLRKLSQEDRSCGMLMFPVIQRAFEQAAGCPLHFSVIHEILDRHGWTLAAVVMTPRQIPLPKEVEGGHVDPVIRRQLRRLKTRGN